MQLNFDNFDALEKRVIASLEATLACAIDSDSYLNERDKSPFDNNWCDAFELIEQSKIKLSSKEKKLLKDRVAVLRETIFKLTIRISHDSELAGYISDDFGLIFDALALNLDDPWIQALLDEYLAGRLPKGSLSSN